MLSAQDLPRSGISHSQCDLRRRLCALDSDDVRIHRRRKINPNSADSKGRSLVSTHLESSLNGWSTSLPLSRQTTIVATLNLGTNIDSPLHTSTSETMWTDEQQPSKWGQDSCLSGLLLTGSIKSDSTERQADRRSSNTMNKNLSHRTVISPLDLNCYVEVER